MPGQHQHARHAREDHQRLGPLGGETPFSAEPAVSAAALVVVITISCVLDESRR